MTTLDLHEPITVRTARGTLVAADAARPFGWAVAIVGGVLGTISGLAEFNSLFTGNGQWVTASIFTISGMALGTAIGAGVGILIDVTLASRR